MNGDGAQFAQAPYPYFGGKSRIAADVWARLGDPPNLVDPFFGSNAFLLARPHWDWERGDWQDGQRRTETVNDASGYLANLWRSLKHDPEATAEWADWPVLENCLHARHAWLVERKADLVARLEGDPDFHDAKIAGWWVWGICAWIAGGWCSGEGPWHVEEGRLVRREGASSGAGVTHGLPFLARAGQGINRGIIRKLPILGNTGVGINAARGRREGLLAWFAALSARLRDVRVCCGDWRRVLGPTPTVQLGMTAVVLDPPYLGSERDMHVYAVDHGTVAWDVREWALAHGGEPLLRLALCGYEAPGYEMPADWECLVWKSLGGYGRQGDGRGKENRHRERVWFNKSCQQPNGFQMHWEL